MRLTKNGNPRQCLKGAIICLFPLLCASWSFGKEQKSEAYYQSIAAKACGGETEVRMADGSRCDIVTEHYAIEVDFASKWKEAIGQSLNYAFQSNKSAGIVLIVEKPTDSLKLMSVIEHYDLPITVWIISSKNEQLTKQR